MTQKAKNSLVYKLDPNIFPNVVQEGTMDMVAVRSLSSQPAVKEHAKRESMFSTNQEG